MSTNREHSAARVRAHQQRVQAERAEQEWRATRSALTMLDALRAAPDPTTVARSLRTFARDCVSALLDALDALDATHADEYRDEHGDVRRHARELVELVAECDAQADASPERAALRTLNVTVARHAARALAGVRGHREHAALLAACQCLEVDAHVAARLVARTCLHHGAANQDDRRATGSG